MTHLYRPSVAAYLLRSLGDGDVLLLSRMLDEVERRGGWSRRGVRGWRFAEEIRAFGLCADRLAWLARRELLDELEERGPGLDVPHRLYRLTSLGATAVECRSGRVTESVIRRPARRRFRPDEGRFFAPAPPNRALVALVRAAERDDGLRWGSPGWLTLAKIHDLAPRGSGIDLESLVWLVAHGYAECRPGFEGLAPLYFRATQRGGRVRVVDESATLRASGAAFVLVREEGPSDRNGAETAGAEQAGALGTPHLDLPRADYEVLAFLRGEALEERGWVRRGRPGWRFTHEMRGAGIPTPWGFQRLHDEGFVDRIDERAPDRERPVYLYRITDAGARWVADKLDEEHRPIEAPRWDLAAHDAGAFFAPHRSVAALGALIRAADESGAAQAWLTAPQAAGLAGLPSIECRDLVWLVERGYGDRRGGASRSGLRGEEFAATEHGRSLRVVASVGINYGRMGYVLTTHDPAAGGGTA